MRKTLGIKPEPIASAGSCDETSVLSNQAEKHSTQISFLSTSPGDPVLLTRCQKPAPGRQIVCQSQACRLAHGDFAFFLALAAHEPFVMLQAIAYIQPD